MPDWEKLVRERLDKLELPRADREEIISELAAHLEETYDDALTHGLDETEALNRSLQEVKDWRVLSADIRRATEGNIMTNRVRMFWLPALASFALTSLLMLALTRISLQAHYLVRLTSGIGLRLYGGWLVTHVLSGALGASLSRRAGGSLSARILSSLFPAIVMFALWGLIIPISAMVQHNAFVLNHPLYYMLGIIPWVLLPGIALLLGALPFLGGPVRIAPTEAYHPEPRAGRLEI